MPDSKIAALGGQSKSPKKKKASRKNGRLGGRPRDKGKRYTRCPRRKYPYDAHWWDKTASPIVCRLCKVPQADAKLPKS
jgi:hypothetical protein